MRYLFLSVAFTFAFVLSGCSGISGSAALPKQSVAAKSAHRFLRAPLGARSILAATDANARTSLCQKPTQASHARCFATLRADSVIGAAFPDAVNGLTPNDLSLLYAYPGPGAQGSAGTGQVVGVVVVGDYALAESDLGVYRSYFGLPPCTTANGCLSKIGAGSAGQPSPPASSDSVSALATTPGTAGWAAETDIDTQLISATCPNCNIKIAEAASDSLADLSNAVVAAINANATIVSASFGAPESAEDRSYYAAYNNYQNVKVVAAAGDWGYGVYFPASDPFVIAAGGTTIAVNADSSISEYAWSGTSSGCSTVFGQRGWQSAWALPPGCDKRVVADAAAVGDPDTGVAIYDSSLNGVSGGWAIFGGTSVSAPIIAGLYALSGDTQRNRGAQTMYSARSSFLNVTSGSNGTCNPVYLCTAGPGYNGPTGIGVPQGLSGF